MAENDPQQANSMDDSSSTEQSSVSILDSDSTHDESRVQKLTSKSDVSSDSLTAPAQKASPPAEVGQNDRYVEQTIDFLDTVFASYPKRDFSFRLWEGTTWHPKNTAGNGAAVKSSFIVTLNHPASLRRMFLPPTDERMALAYTMGDFELDGDVGNALDLGKHLWDTWSWYDIIASAFKLLRLPSRGMMVDSHAAQLSGSFHSEQRDRNAIKFHYDMGNDFYKLWLDQRLVYSCGYFRSLDTSLDDAQLHKLDMLCRKLRLKPNDRLLDIGCGWGALAIHAAKHYGAIVTGVTLSDEQVSLACERAKAEGVTDKVTIKLLDYRKVMGTFDKIVSVGMVEHIGRYNLREYFDKAYSLLQPGGVFLNHGITLLHDEFKSQRKMRQGFFCKYIFPDGDVQPLPYILQRAADSHFEIRDVESLREHYALTLDHWKRRFDQHEDKLVSMVGRDTFRLWCLYLLAANWGFKTGLHAIYQTLLIKSVDFRYSPEVLPLTRDDWYTDSKTTTSSESENDN